MRNLNVLPVNRRARPREICNADREKQNRDREQREAHRQQRSTWNESAPLAIVIIASSSATIAGTKIARPTTIGAGRLQFLNFENRRHIHKITDHPSPITTHHLSLVETHADPCPSHRKCPSRARRPLRLWTAGRRDSGIYKCLP